MPAIPPAIDRYAVIGNPVDHSRSPAIHAMFARQTGQALTYERRLAPLDGFDASVRRFFADGGRGLNVTLPFKLAAHALADTLSARARGAGAVNTLSVDANGRLHGENTDGIGLVRDIEANLRVTIAGARVLLLGAGGAARGALLPLLDRRPAAITIVNRSAPRAVELADRFCVDAARAGCHVAGGDSAVAHGVFDIVINATSSSLANALPRFPAAALGPGTLAYDMMYGAAPTPFMRHAAVLGARPADGLGMLVEQAAEAFFLWRGVRPDTAALLVALRMVSGTDTDGAAPGAPGAPEAQR